VVKTARGFLIIIWVRLPCYELSRVMFFSGHHLTGKSSPPVESQTSALVY
jgi:hypothetical protein